jgi:polyribonucleotide nucleotidyltransferase
MVKEIEINQIYTGRVVKILGAGAFVRLPNGVDGFVHISKLADYRVASVDEILSENQEIGVKVLGFDMKGKPRLSYRDVDQKTGADLDPHRTRK